MFGIPSVLIPLPGSADDHQMLNAREFEGIGGADVLPQVDAKPDKLVELVAGWQDPERRMKASRSLQQWDNPEATLQIVERLLS
jgi:UDP-N-acetylglucosamine--N-acetylmuramyl-(pentapeptide) pyrophosphoryl-undecaprenol N-acetylglucosamine transferase